LSASYEPAQTVELPVHAQQLAERHRYRLRTKPRRDGRIAYELLDELTGRLIGRSTNFSKLYAHLKRGLGRSR
jgi:hypothetical protein